MQFENETDFNSEKNYGSGGHKIIILLTDGTEEWAEEVVNKFVPLREDGSRDVNVSHESVNGHGPDTPGTKTTVAPLK